jgi:hypothetical protein
LRRDRIFPSSSLRAFRREWLGIIDGRTEARNSRASRPVGDTIAIAHADEGVLRDLEGASTALYATDAEGMLTHFNKAVSASLAARPLRDATAGA